MKRLKLFCLVLTLGASAASAFTPGGRAPAPLGFLDHDSDMRWRYFLETKVIEDHAKGLYSATFAPFLTRIDGTRFSISGFMMPLGAGQTTRHFILTRRNASCPFCSPNEPTEAIEVFTDAPVKLSDSAVIVEGQFKLVAHTTQGLFYRIDKARTI